MTKAIRIYLKICLLIGGLGLIAGVGIWIYSIIFPTSNDGFDYRAYYTNKKGINEQTFMTEDKSHVYLITEYYAKKENKHAGKTLLSEDKGTFFFIPKNSRVKILDTLVDDILLVEVLYTDYMEDTIKRKGFIPFINIHPAESR